MHLFKNYTPPSPDELTLLKDSLKHTGREMADLAGVASTSQWRKYTGGVSPRAMSPHILFFIAAQLALSDDDLRRVIGKMREIGAGFE